MTSPLAGVRNVDGLLQRQAAENPGSTALVEAGRRTSWLDLDRQVEGAARGLAELGLVAGHRVAIASANRAELVAGYLAVLRAGMVAVPVDPTSGPAEVERVLADTGARVCLADECAVGSVRAAVAALDSPVLVVVIGAATVSGEMGYGDLPVDGARVVSPRDPESLAVLAYTSGTSGRPRAAMLSHRALLANIEQGAQVTPPVVRPGDVVLAVVPMFQLYGLNAVLGQVLLTGATLVVGDRPSPEETLTLIEREEVSCVPVAPALVRAWLGQPDLETRLASVRVLVSAGAPMAEATVREFENRTGIAVEQGYGLTEAGPVVTSTIGCPVHKPGSAGRALPGVELRVVDEAEAAQARLDRPDADPGEIWVRGPNLFSGYWPDHARSPGGQDGWMRTGDIGLIDADGDLFLVDRLKELVVVSGFNVYPSEIEDVIAELGQVRECAVIGVGEAGLGERVVAFVVPTAGQADQDREALAALVLAHCAERLARFKVPARVEVVDGLPHSATGKVAKGRLRAGQPGGGIWE